jgi:hypothetical protein
MRPRANLLLMAFAASLPLALAPSPADAYLGPGGGLSLLTTALAMFAAFSVSAMVVLTWPVRAVKGWLKRRHNKKQGDASNTDEQQAEDKR